MTLKDGIKRLAFLSFFICLFSTGFSQYSTYGKVTFERKTNLEKRFTDKRMRNMINEDNKIKIDKFQILQFS